MKFKRARVITVGAVAIWATAGCMGFGETARARDRVNAATAVAPGQAAAGIPQWKGAAPNGTNVFRFVVMSDNTGGHKPGEWEEAIAEINLLKPDFVICVGDLIEGYTTNPVELAEMRTEFEAMTARLNAPFYYCPGNHDISNPMMDEDWAARYGVNGRSYYSFDYRNSHFVVLDTASYLFNRTRFFEEQLTWLEKDLDSARNADHVFIFTHIPQYEDTASWPRLAKLLDPRKTTIFNGHWHSAGYIEAEGIPTYVLGGTGTRYGNDEADRRREMINPDLGRYRMFAQVAVDGGKPTVAFLTLHEIRPGDYLGMAFPANFQRSLWPIDPLPDPISAKTGDDLVLIFTNALSTPFTLKLFWDAPGWRVQPPTEQITLAPGATGAVNFRVAPAVADPGRLILYRSGETINRIGRTVTQQIGNPLTVYAELDAPRVEDLVVDGDSRDWTAVSAQRMVGSNHLWLAENLWRGAGDLAVDWRVAWDAERLYVLAEVSDDQIVTSGGEVWDNDAVEFFWDSRPIAERNGKRGPQTGQVILGIPAEGVAVSPIWEMGKQPKPQGLQAAIRRRPGGYVCELSLPFSELGLVSPPKPGDPIHLELQVDDRDLVDGRPQIKHQCINGEPGNYQYTARYARCTLR